MEIYKLKKGQVDSLPCNVVGGTGGFVSVKAPSDGIKIKLTAMEGAGNCIFVSNKQLEESGFVSAISAKKRVEKLIELFSRKELVEMAKRLGLPAKGTKEKLAKIVLSDF